MRLLFTLFQPAVCTRVRVCEVDMYERASRRNVRVCRPATSRNAAAHNAAAAAASVNAMKQIEQMMHTEHEVCKLLSQPLKQSTATGRSAKFRNATIDPQSWLRVCTALRCHAAPGTLTNALEQATHAAVVYTVSATCVQNRQGLQS